MSGSAEGHGVRKDNAARLRLPARRFPSRRYWLGGAILWGLAMAAAVLAALYLRNRLETGRLVPILLVYFAGGALAWMPAGLLAHVATRRARRETRFAAHFLCLTVFTVAVTAFVFALDYRTFYAQWHAPVFTYIWCLQQIFTMAGASYQFLVIGVPLFLPLGLPLLLATSLLLAWSGR